MTFEQQAQNAESWYYEINGQRIGPVPESRVITLIQSGDLYHGCAVWKKGFQDWLSIEQTDLRQHLDNAVPPPLSGNHVNNSIVWVLAFAPILGTMLEYFFAGMFSGSQHAAESAVASGKYIFVTILLNIGLSFWDEKRLEKAGVRTERFKGWIWLVPVYLFQRAKALKQSVGYFVVWIISFVLILLAMAS